MLDPSVRRHAVVAAACLAMLVLAPAPAVSAPEAEHGMVTSFDDTPIAYTLFLPDTADPAPVIFTTHGWGGSRVRAATGLVGALLDQGYAVLTWDARGFGDSGGEVNVDSQQFEVRDVQALIDMVAERDEIQRDAPGDPRMGMIGVSYAGGIQLMTAAADERIDAIVPQIAWNDLVQSLLPNGVVKLGWGSLLYGSGVATASSDGLDSPGGPKTGVYATQIHEAFAQSVALNTWSEDIKSWFDARSPTHYIDGGVAPGIGTRRSLPGITTPALIIQGVSDTLFNLNEGIANFNAIRRNGVESRLMIFCGGHTLNVAGSSCSVNAADGPSQAEVIEQAILGWFDRHVRDPLGDARAGPMIRYQLQDGRFEQRRALPETTVRASGEGRVVNTIAPTSGVFTAGTPSRDGFRLEVPVRPNEQLLGIPRATLQVTGTGTEAFLFVKLLDVGPDGEAVVIDDQVTPARFGALSAQPQTVEIDLAGVSWEVLEDHRIMVEVAPTSSDFNTSRVPWIADVTASVSVPVVREQRAGEAGGSVVSPRRAVLPATGATSREPAGISALLVALLAGLALVSRRSHRRTDGCR